MKSSLLRSRHRLAFHLLAATLSLAWGMLSTLECKGADGIEFGRDVRPILSDKCYFCHGPDEGHRQADLRLDVRESAIEAIESGSLVERITSTDPEVMMPPPASKLKLSEQDKRTLSQWVDQGAAYQGHWAFQLLADEIPLPNPKGTAWIKQPIDRFVLSKLENEGIAPSRQAEPLRWLRRVTLDLTGLPPTSAQVEGFQKSLANQGDLAYEAMVDQLLESHAFGEHMAVAWLDSVRYADSYGYQSDKLNTQWPYRDWVVRAFNNNLPYDQFLTWQLAGDLLESPTPDQRLATAFNRIHRLNNEGGAVFEEWRIENVADRVHTFGTTVLGLTMECCRCHDHKYDPVTMRDYYSLSAFFNSIDESGVYDRTEKVPSPSMLLPDPDQERDLQAAKQRVIELTSVYEEIRQQSVARFAMWQAQSTKDFPIPDLRLALSFDRDFEDAFKTIYYPSELDRTRTQMVDQVPVTDSTLPPLDISLAADKGKEGELPERRALALDGERGITTLGIEPFDRWTAFTVIVSLRETKRATERSLIAHHTRGTDCGYNGWDLTIENGYLESRMYRHWPGNSIGVRTVDPIPVDQWHQIAASYDGSSTAGGLKLFLNGKQLLTTVLRDSVIKSANVKVDHGGEFVVGQRFRARGLAGSLIDDVRIYDRELTDTELSHLATGEPLKPTAEYYASAIDEATRMAFKELTEARKTFVMAEEVMVEIPIMQELSEPRPAYVLARGQYDAPQTDETRVQRSTMASLSLPFPADAPVNRLGLARWVTNPSHPLTARVAVNRMWGNFFADPLVRTPENFGLQGETPTHPALLDWLARDFIDHGWDVKRFCKQVALSSTYQQDSAVSSETLERDPTNRLLARGPSFRLAAEQIRDVALSASGLMNTQQGGPPVSPYQPGEDLWREANGMSPPYKQSVGESLYRRSLYSVWKRTVPLPNMMAFDATTREVCAVKRSRTNTPLQALVLLNDVQFVEAARALAEQVVSQPTETEGIQSAFVRLTGRPANESEQEVLLNLLAGERAYYLEHSDEAIRLVKIGQHPLPETLSVSEVAAMTTVCQAILNLDATIWRR